jgi:hypothetical protein
MNSGRPNVSGIEQCYVVESARLQLRGELTIWSNPGGQPAVLSLSTSISNCFSFNK